MPGDVDAAAEVGAVRGALPPWAAEDYACADCAVSYPQITVERAREVIAGIPAAVRDTVASLPSEALSYRPSVGVWSVLEYVCHLRDVYVTYTIRLHRTRTEQRPVLEPMLNDLRARRFRYNERDLAPTLDELASAVAGFGDEIAGNSGHDWERLATRMPGEQRTGRWLARQAMHEGVHHLGDIRTIADTFARTD